MFRQNKKLITGVVIGILMAVSMLLAEVPNLIDYQGRLADAGGSPVNGNVSILFSIYDMETGGTSLWSETQGSVNVDDGLFQVTLGSSYAMPDTLFNEPDRWLGIAVGTDAEMTPRTKIASTPYALYAAKGPHWKEDDDGIYYEGIIKVVRPDSSSRIVTASGIKLPEYSYNDMQILAQQGLPPNGMQVYCPNHETAYHWSGSEWIPFGHWEPDGSGNLSNSNLGNVGIGTDSPTAKLDIVAEASSAFKAVSSGNVSTVSIENTSPGGDALEVNGTTNLNPSAAGSFAAIIGGQTAMYSYDGTVLDVNGQENGGASAAVFTSNSATEPTVSIQQNGDGNGVSAASNGAGNAGQFTNWGPEGTGISTANYGTGTGDGIYAGAMGSNRAGYFGGDTHVNGTLSKSGGSFLIDHPFDPANKYLSHSFVESPDMMNVYNGNVVLDNQGEAVVKLPHYFENINIEFRYQLTCIGGFAQVYIAEKISGNKFKIDGGKDGLEVSWQVTGIRNDPYAKAHRIQVEKDKPAHEKGKYLHPELYGQGEEKGMRYE